MIDFVQPAKCFFLRLYLVTLCVRNLKAQCQTEAKQKLRPPLSLKQINLKINKLFIIDITYYKDSHRFGIISKVNDQFERLGYLRIDC